MENEKSSIVNEDDLRHLHNLVEEKDGGPAWIQMMDRSTSNMTYQAWRRDPEVNSSCRVGFRFGLIVFQGRLIFAHICLDYNAELFNLILSNFWLSYRLDLHNIAVELFMKMLLLKC